MAFVEVLIAAVAAFLLGFLWYTALFGKAWQKETGVTDEQAQSGMGITHGGAFLMMYIIAFGINVIVNLHAPEDQTFVHGGFHGLMSAAFFAIPAMVIHYLYQKKSVKLMLIDGGDLLLFFALMGGVLGALSL